MIHTMWALDNRTAYAAERNWTRDKAGAHHWLVAVRATFALAPDSRLSLADEQPAPILEPRHRGEPGRSSLLFDSDLLALKPTTDILVDGKAHAPRGRPAPFVPVRLRVGDITKTLVVHGARTYTKRLIGGVALSKAEPFAQRELTYEWAFGGVDASSEDPRKHRMDARNPVGRGFAVNPARLDGQLAHAIEYAEGDFAERGPAGFGPIDRAWSPRREHAGTYGAHWEKSKKPLLPDDYDDRFACCAPEDQRPNVPLRGGEQIELVHMTPSGVLRFELPKIHLVFKTDIRGRREEHRAKLATLLLEPEHLRVSMTWQSSLRVSRRDVDYLDETTIDEKPFLT